MFGLLEPAESAERQNRTDDTAIFSRVLYQLSYLGQYLVVKRQDFTSRLGDCQAEVVMKIKSKPGLSKRYATGIMPSAFPQGMVSGRGSARLERTVRVREVGGSNPPAPTADLTGVPVRFFVRRTFPRKTHGRSRPINN